MGSVLSVTCVVFNCSALSAGDHFDFKLKISAAIM